MSLDFLAHVRTESDRFVDALRDIDPAARVPSCPEWSAADLLWHLADVHYTWAETVARRLTDGATVEAEVDGSLARPADYSELLAVYSQQTDALVAALEAAADDEPVWTWAADQSVGFVRRFQAHEAMIHRVDAELTAGAAPSPLPTVLADDGVDVVLRYGKTWRPGWAEWQLSDTIGRLHATDTDRRWTVRLGTWSGHSPDTGKTYDGQDAIELVEDHDQTATEPEFTVHASAADLDAWLWCRPGYGDVSFDGETAGARRFEELVKGGMP